MKKSGGHFEGDQETFAIYCVVARSFGCLPSDLLGLSWHELLFNVQCAQHRSDVFRKLMQQSNRKKAMLFPTINLGDLADVL